MLGCSDAGRLVMSRAPVRFTGVGLAGSGPGAPEVPASVGGPRSGAGRSMPDAAGATCLAAAFFVAAAFFAGGAGSSGWTGRRRPSRSAFRRARSAWASSMDDEWLLTPMPNDRHRSRASLLVRPSSWASS